MNNNTRLSACILLCLSACSANSEKQVQIYSAPKQVAAAAPAPQGQAPQGMPDGSLPPNHPKIENSASNSNAPAAPSPFEWKTPKGWTEKAGNSVRLVSFDVPGSPEQASVIILGGDAGGFLPNLNRWRGQLEMQPVDEATAKKSAKKDQSALGAFQWFELNNPASAEKSMLVAIVPIPDATIFVKLVGTKKITSENRDAFISLCRSLSKRKS